MRRPIKIGWGGSTAPSTVEGSPGLAADPQYSREILFMDPSVAASQT
jgi:hypothetical protein